MSVLAKGNHHHHHYRHHHHCHYQQSLHEETPVQAIDEDDVKFYETLKLNILLGQKEECVARESRGAKGKGQGRKKGVGHGGPYIFTRLTLTAAIAQR